MLKGPAVSDLFANGSKTDTRSRASPFARLQIAAFPCL